MAANGVGKQLVHGVMHGQSYQELGGITRMADYDILPPQSIGPVSLGMTQEEVRRVMGVPSVSLPFRGRLAPEDTYDQRGFFRIEYDFDCRVRFIEVSPNHGVSFFYKTCSVFGTKADDVISFIETDAAIDTSHHDFPATVVFPTLELALWRHCLPEESGGEEGTYFESLSIAIPGYFKRAAS